MEEILEALMVISFGASWPASIVKSYKGRTAKGKSLLFLCLIEFGYVCGIIWKIIVYSNTGEFNYPAYFYILNFVMILAELFLYFRNTKLDKQRDSENK